MYLSTLSQIFAITIIFGFTYCVFAAIGLRRDSLAYSRREKLAFDTLIAGALGRLATVTNIFGTLTSLATVYVFFIGTSKIFGGAVFACIASLLLGTVVTLYFTRRLMINPHIKQMYQSSDQVTAVVSSLFWADTNDGRRNSFLIKYISISNLAGVIWLEFAVFADLSRLLTGGTTFTGVAFCILMSFLVIFFIMRFGLRGFVFADLLQSPLVAISSVVVFAGICYSVIFTDNLKLTGVLHPIASPLEVWLFVLHVFILNSFLVLVTEGHWLRMWLFGERELRLQRPAISSTAITWAILILIGLIGGTVTSATGDNAIADILAFVQDRAPFVIVAFWVAAVAALFSTADGNIYGLLMVLSFNPAEGKLSGSNIPVHHAVIAAGASCAIGLVYFAVRELAIPFEKIVFILIPLCMNIVPSLMCGAFHRRVSPAFTMISLTGYGVLSVLGMLQPQQELVGTLTAALFPFIVGSLALLIQPRLAAVPESIT